MSEISKTYSAKEIESKWYQTWLEGGYFKPKKGKANDAFCIIMPPPNVTGKLHEGHALDATTQDALIRFKRMKGFEALWLPGMDHAGIATQSVVEKMVWEQEKKTRHDFEKEDFIKKIWQWKEEYGGIIANQQRLLGASCDWDYSMFTMDPEANEAVRKVFVDLYNEGLIYQSDYIINWDPVLHSAISDAEVEHKEVQGAFYHILYKVKGTDETLEVATTRPETLLGDTAVCVHPEDERFQKYIGKTAIIPICNREIPIIADDYVDTEKGTGCLKVTPGHDFNDFEIGQRHKLPIITILNKDATFNENGAPLQGMDVKAGRKKIVELLEEAGQLVKVEKHVHQVGHGDRSKAVIEPLVSKQWFLNVQEMSKRSVESVEKEQMKFFPKGWENTYFSWLREPKDWCISRQLWWGHQIPVFYCNDCDNQWASTEEESNCSKCNSSSITQDPDVLDTWFSSALWPFSTLGWPDEQRMKDKKFETFYPTSVLITGYDIIFFWVARMMMMGLKFTGEEPFHSTYIHAIVRDKFGRKISKSLGNGIDPIRTIEEYSADAFRFTLASGSGYNRGINLDPDRIVGYRNFINKVWNAFRFIHPVLEKSEAQLPELSKLDAHEKWILAELNTTAKTMNDSLEVFRFDEASMAIYQFVYDKYCSWFIELSKPILNGNDESKIIQRATVLKYVLKKMVALLHPITPFVTEELWSFIKDDKEDLLIIQDYPEYEEQFNFTKEQNEMNQFTEVITGIRNLRSSVNIKPSEEIEVQLFIDNEASTSYFKTNEESLQKMAKVNKLTIENKSSARPEKSIFMSTSHLDIFIPLSGVIDIEAHVAKLNKDLTKLQKEFDKYDKKLHNPKFIENAKEEVIAEVKFNHGEVSSKINALKENIELFNK
jgi:valyl-tRNA synthetase